MRRVALAVFLIAGCKSDPASTTSAPTPIASSTPTPAPPSTPKPQLACRALSLTGHVAIGAAADGGAPHLYPSGDIPPTAWLDLPEASKVTAKDPRTTRETTFVGPAHVKACVHGEEESWIAAGTFESGTGAGEALGAEEWVVTPLGVARYGSAALNVAVTANLVTVRVDKGTAFVAPAADARAEQRDASAGDAGGDGGWTRVDAPATLLLKPARAAPPAQQAEIALGICTRLANEAWSLAKLLAAPDAAVGDLTPRHVAARRGARAACAVAEIRAEGAPAPQRGVLVEKAREVSATWKSLDR